MVLPTATTFNPLSAKQTRLTCVVAAVLVVVVIALYVVALEFKPPKAQEAAVVDNSTEAAAQDPSSNHSAVHHMEKRSVEKLFAKLNRFVDKKLGKLNHAARKKAFVHHGSPVLRVVEEAPVAPVGAVAAVDYDAPDFRVEDTFAAQEASGHFHPFDAQTGRAPHNHFHDASRAGFLPLPEARFAPQPVYSSRGLGGFGSFLSGLFLGRGHAHRHAHHSSIEHDATHFSGAESRARPSFSSGAEFRARPSSSGTEFRAVHAAFKK